jgi:hypothetical protein
MLRDSLGTYFFGLLGVLFGIAGVAALYYGDLPFFHSPNNYVIPLIFLMAVFSLSVGLMIRMSRRRSFANFEKQHRPPATSKASA